MELHNFAGLVQPTTQRSELLDGSEQKAKMPELVQPTADITRSCHMGATTGARLSAAYGSSIQPAILTRQRMTSATLQA
jgi:hypothetical protein